MREKLEISNKRATTRGFFVADFSSLKGLAPAEWLMLGSFGVYCFVFPWAMLLMSFDWMPFGMEWMGSLLLAMLGLTSVGWLWTNHGRVGPALGSGIFILGVALEYVGVTTGFPFGAYRYTGVLMPQLPGGVPLAIGFAWLLIVVSSIYTAGWLFSPAPGLRSSIILSLAGALLAVGLDLLLEPVAYHIKNYWVWEKSDAFYYGIPTGNFVAWLVISFAMNLIVTRLAGKQAKLKWTWVPVALFGMNLALFGVVDVAHGYWIAGAIGVVVLGIMGIKLSRSP